MIKAVIFDMDGLMFDTEHLSVQAWQYAGKQLGYDITEQMIYETFGLSEENARFVYEKYFGEKMDYRTMLKERIQYAQNYIIQNGIPIKKGLLELLNYLKQNQYDMTVATSSTKERAYHYFHLGGIEHFFHKIVTGDMISHGKPEPDIYLKACEILSKKPEECIALEDSYNGIIAAYRAGVLPIMIPDIMKPDIEIKKLLFAELSSLTDVIIFLEEYNKCRKK